jgi:hypothetical protein
LHPGNVVTYLVSGGCVGTSLKKNFDTDKAIHANNYEHSGQTIAIKARGTYLPIRS